ncbi:sensor domain-containing diguanylate cyclase [Lysobacter solisilvae (ex Woo and Kim 2020)]|uniref:diguanylate cyclase n=1 Tax=Agrilutibacter terrestris TaxID=2865112 RepID=A0A7H0FWQ3_9GAMM|nr:diguanylate cyclase [Lysobacter terrestris]QNP40469.1 GGDEF domain-containing protein [Lysobacter terrestris]
MGIARSLLGACLGWLLLLTALPARAADTVVLTDATPAVPLSSHVLYYHDAAAKDSLRDSAHKLANNRFARLPDESAAFGFQTGAYWFHVRLLNRSEREQRWLLVQQYALSDNIDVYANYADGRTQHWRGGDALPFADGRSISYRHPNFLIDLPREQPVDVFVRVQSQSSMQVPLKLYTQAAFTEMSRDAQLGMGVYYGILLALFFYNMVLWLTLRDASYFWYLLHICAFGLVLFTLNGLGFEYLWPNSTWLADKSVPLSICLSQVGMQQFTRTFLGLRERWRLGDRISLGIIAFYVLLGLAATQLPYHVTTPIASATVFLSISWVAALGLVITRRGYKPAVIFLLAWAMFLLGTGMFAAVAFGLVPKVFLTEYGKEIGSAMEMLLLSIGLGYRYSALRSENERIIRDSRDQLEQKVAQRTSELSNALNQLADAHGRLRESSQRDSLTGLHNRSFFHEGMEGLLSQARSGRHLSLLMIDLDHFKQINDRHGHLVGDACLRWAAGVIGQTLRQHNALLARFGGEEFVVALPGTDLEGATHVAEELRARLRAEPFRCEGATIQVTASFGVHSVDTRSKAGAETALQRADEALYRAKADGRDCVRTSAVMAA